jgi:hypothetical protein
MKKYFIFEPWLRGIMSAFIAGWCYFNMWTIYRLPTIASGTLGPMVWMLPAVATLAMMALLLYSWRSIEIDPSQQMIHMDYNLFLLRVWRKSYSLNLFDRVSAYPSPKGFVLALVGREHELVILTATKPSRARTLAGEISRQTKLAVRDQLP